MFKACKQFKIPKSSLKYFLYLETWRVGHSSQGQNHQGAPRQGGCLHRHLLQGWPEGQVGLQGWGDLQGEADQDRGPGGWEQGDDHPPADHQEAHVQEHGQVHRHLQRRADRLLPWCRGWVDCIVWEIWSDLSDDCLQFVRSWRSIDYQYHNIILFPFN